MSKKQTIKDTAKYYKDHKYVVIKNFISKEQAEFIYNYGIIRAQRAATMANSKWPGYREDIDGTFKDKQVSGVYSCYSDLAMETLLMKVKPKMEQVLEMELIPSYSYTRLYEKGSELKKHTDRIACEISTTLNLGGDPWPIYFKLENEVRVDLKPGDMVLYLGEKIPHWRNKFEGDICGQVFLHYNTKQRNNIVADGRPFVGLPQPYRNGKFVKK